MFFRGNVLVFCFVLVTLYGVPAVYIENNAYKGITIAFSPTLQGHEVSSTKLKNVIQKASELLYRATRRRAFFSEIDFLYPSTWTNACEQNSTEAQQPQRISVYVSGFKNKDGEDSLHTQHSKGCGAEGEIIYMAPGWLDGVEEELAREFVQQWAIYRYGVFEEIAEPELEAWPCYTNDGKHWIQNGCYSSEISVDLVLDDDKGLPSCKSVDIANRNFRSSLMSSVQSSSITDFCDGSKLRPHNPTAPTRHNRLCSGKPVWSVIKESEDFRLGKNLPRGEDFTPPNVSFRCFQEIKNHIVFSIQVSSKENVENIVDNIRLSLLRFLLFEVWPETQVSIVTFNKVAKDPFHLDLTKPEQAFGDVDDKVRVLDLVTDVCLSCGLKGAFDLSKGNESKNTAVVFMVFASALMNQNLGVLTDLLESAPSRTYMIIIQDQQEDFTSPNLIRAARKTGGEVFVVPISPAILVTRMTFFLTNVLKNPVSIEDKAVIIHQSSFVNIIGKTFEDSVEADSCIEGKMTYTLICDSNRLDALDTGTICSKLPHMQIMNTKIKCGYTATLTKETSLRNWTFFFQDKGGALPLTCSSLATVQLKPNSTDLTVKGWISTDTVEPGQPGRSALIIYAEVRYNSVPVTNANIHAAVYSSTDSTPTMVELLDSGNGDPDMKKEDGVYSRYFTRILNRGIHSVIIHAKGDLTNCGPTHANQNQMRFSRTVPAGSFVVTEQPNQMDYHPPNRIGDLRVISIDHNDSLVTLQWTAPGDNYDDGTAKRYNIKFSQTMSVLQETNFGAGNSESVEGISQEIHMLPSGELQKVTIQLPPPKENRPYYLAVQTVNKNSDASKMSNIVQIFFTKSGPDIKTTTTVPETSQEVSNFTSVNESRSPEFTDSVTEELTQTSENWENNSTLEPIANSTSIFTPTTADNTTENLTSITTTGTSTGTTKDPSSRGNMDLCDKKYVIILASSVVGGIIALFLIINAIVCCICFRKRRNPNKRSKKVYMRPPRNMTMEGPATGSGSAFPGPRGSILENMQDFELDSDAFVPRSKRAKSIDRNYYTSATTMRVDETIDSAPSTSTGVRYRRNYEEHNTETGTVSLGVV